ncbi:MAG: histidine kinase [Henriciella sp.]|nr:histidine kinase [Henriciella sp.]
MFERLRPFLAPSGTSLKSFWTFQLIFWSFNFVWRLLYNISHGMGAGWQSTAPRLVSMTISALTVLVLAHIAVRLMPRRLRFERLAMIVGITLVWALVLAFVDRSIFSLFKGKYSLSHILMHDVPMTYFFSSWMFVSWVILFLLIGQFSRLRERDTAIYELKASEKEARMQMLVHQLNPHFLFNTLNSISALINETRPNDADQMIARLSRFLRHVVDLNPSNLISLDEELAILHDYTDIQTVRYGDQLDITTSCEDKSVCHAQVPKMILQPLVENSIKYGRLKPGHVIRVKVTAKAYGSRLALRVEDNGPGFPEKPSPDGLGLLLVRERLEAHFGDDADLRTSNLEPSGSRVEIRMPLRLPSDEDEGNE